MASSSSSSSPRTWKYRVFTSFHGSDVRKNWLSHLRKQFDYNGISMFDDQRIERSHTIAPALSLAIQESRISIVVLSKNYASSGWCLNELVEILKCRQDLKQIVMTVFYGVDPGEVRNQTGDFGKIFEEFCARKTEEERRKWSHALNVVGNIAGEHLLNWDKESKMIEKIARDVSNKLNTTISKDFEDMVGIEAHLKKMESLLQLDNQDVAMIVGVCGPAGIGKTTIARALHTRLSSSFQLACFMENVRGSYNRGIDEYGWKLSLQEKLLAKILNHNDGMRIYHLGAIRERLCDQKVLIILDDVDDMKQLEALADETNWFGPGSRIIITTEDGEILEKRGINNAYPVGFPKEEEACKIFCRYAFRGRLAPDGFEKLIERVAKLCCNLPLGLRVMGSCFLGKRESEWESILQRLEDSIDLEIEGVLRVGYDSLHKNDQLLFLLIAFFFNYQDRDHVMDMLAENKLDAKLGLKTLEYRSLIQISAEGNIVVMHKLLQQVGREAVERQEPWKRQVLIDTDEISDVLENDSGTSSVKGISLDISTIKDDVYISAGAFRKMHNLLYLKIYKTRFDTDDRVHVPEDMSFPRRIRSIYWELYPGKSLPSTFKPEYLVELDLQQNRLKKLWKGVQPLPNLKKMNLICSFSLEELPDLSNATNLKRLDLTDCFRLIKIPSSFASLHKLEWLGMRLCIMLRAVPDHLNLESLKEVYMEGCRRLKKIPDISKNITTLSISDTMLQELPESMSCLSHLESLYIDGSALNVSLPGETQGQMGADVERIPDWIKDFHSLKRLFISGCPKLASLPQLPASLRGLAVRDCDSLETLSFSFDSPIEYIYFPNCFKLGLDAWRVVFQQSLQSFIPGRKIPEEFDHRAIGNFLTVRLDTYRFRICAVLSPKPQMEYANPKIWCRVRINGRPTGHYMQQRMGGFQTEHLCVFDFSQYGWLEQDMETLFEFEFNTTPKCIDVIECGLQILMGA